MAETPEQIVERELREFKRYTGDGLANEPVGAPLPTGDPQSGVWNPKKVNLRTVLKTVLEETFAARDEAVAAAPSTWEDLRDETVEARDKSQEWAENPEDEEVEAGQYSALHHAAKASAQRVLAETAATTSESARNAALAAVNADSIFAETTIAAAETAGLSGTAEGDTFYATGDDVDYIGLYRHDSGPLATELAQVPKASVVNENVGERLVGHDPSAGGTTGATGSYYFWPDTLANYDQVLTKLEVANGGNEAARIAVAFVEGDGTLTLVASYPITVVDGSISVDLNILVPAGCVVGLGALGAPKSDPVSNTPLWNTPSIPTISTSKNITMSVAVRHRYTLTALVKARALAAYAGVESLGIVVGGETIVGWPDPLSTSGGGAPDYTVILEDEHSDNSRVTSVRISTNNAGAATVFVCTIGAGPTATVIRSQAVTLAAGENRVPIDLEINADEHIGIFVPGATGIKFQNSANPSRTSYWFSTSMPSTDSAVTFASLHRFELQFEVVSGLYARLGDTSLPQGTGLTLMDDADPNGVEDATAIATAARSAHPNPYVRPGTFAVTSVPRSGDGFWGPGRFVQSNRSFVLPRSPRVGSLYEGLRQRLATCIGTGAPLIAIGDSITHWSAASSAEKHWLDQLCGFANFLHSPGDVPIMTSFGNIDVYTPAFYGVTFTGSTSGGSRGPIGNTTAGSVVLADGAALTFTGTFEEIGFTYTQEPNAGTLSVKRDAVTLATIDADGELALDQWSGLTETSVTSSATYSIMASGGPVEITSLLRLGVRAATDIKRLHVMRAARGSFAMPDFGPDEITSMMAIAGHLSASPPTVLISLGVNDAASVTTAAAMKTRADTLIDDLKSGGVDDIIGVLPMRPSGGSWVSRTENFDAVIAGLTQSYRAQGIQIIRPAFDLSGGGMTSDGLHPNDIGNETLVSVIAEALAN